MWKGMGLTEDLPGGGRGGLGGRAVWECKKYSPIPAPFIMLPSVGNHPLGKRNELPS